jgi:hypothetical protein
MNTSTIARFRLRIPDGIPGADRITFDWKQVEHCFRREHDELMFVLPTVGGDLVIRDGAELDVTTATQLVEFLVAFGGQHSTVL